ncbi:hypothetical protein QAD02_015334 [Eretmocerus hayati]|uniref:Uncharacterized protein n=1 Tax=Eretmocerus hayati TaxID=131215 RepID=A0ACC2P7Y7_9HYME|nr:hypothetical protein QAD02_015334 [Eretmocerus hayati]
MFGLGTSNDKQLKLEWKRVLDFFRVPEKNDLEMASAIYIDSALQVLSEFVTNNKKELGISVEQIDFKDDIDSARIINAWASKETKQKIQRVIKSDDIDEYTKIILVNALSFKSDWLIPFELQPEKRTFYNMDKTRTELVTMMFLKAPLFHGVIQQLDASLIMIPYQNTDFEMILMVTPDTYGLERLETEFDWNLVLNACGNVTSKSKTIVELSMPKFEIEFRSNLKSSLKQLGMNSLFEENADFSLISKEPLYIDKILQKTFVRVDEKGSEVAAATAASVRTRRSINNSEYLVLDHPFMFIIHHKPSQMPLFIGSVKYLETKVEKRLRTEL